MAVWTGLYAGTVDPEVRHRAVEPARLGEKRIAPPIAKDLGIAKSDRRRWVKQPDIEDDQRTSRRFDERPAGPAAPGEAVPE